MLELCKEFSSNDSEIDLRCPYCGESDTIYVDEHDLGNNDVTVKCGECDKEYIVKLFIDKIYYSDVEIYKITENEDIVITEEDEIKNGQLFL